MRYRAVVCAVALNLSLAGVAFGADQYAIDPVHSTVGFTARHLRSADFLDAANYPTITFKSTQIKKRGKTRVGMETGLTINRQDYGVKWNKTMDNGGLVVGNDVKINLNVEGVR